MKKCPVCGQPMDDNELFCASCGAKYEAPAQAPAGGFCHNCGERLEAGVVFCPNCGADQRAAQPEAPSAPAYSAPAAAAPAASKKGFNFRILGIAGAAVAAVAVIVAAVFLLKGAFASPADKFLSYQLDLPGQVVEQLTGAVEKVNKAEFSTDMTLTASTKNSDYKKILKDTSITLKLDLKKDAALINAGVKLMGSDIISGILTADTKTIGAAIPELDDAYYSISVEALLELLGVDMDDIGGKLETPEIPVQDVLKLSKKYLDIITGVVTKENVEKSEKDSFKLNELGKKLDGESYVFKPTAEDIEKMVEKLADTLEKDKELRKVVMDYVKKNETLLETAGLDADEFEEELEEFLDELVEELRDNAEDIGEQIENAKLTWTVGISKGKLALDRIEAGKGDVVIAYEHTDDDTVFYVEDNGEKEMLVHVEHKEKDGKLKGYISYSEQTYDYTYDYYYGYSSSRSLKEQFRLEYKNVELKKTSILGIPYGTYTTEIDGETVKLEVAAGKSGGTDHTVTLPEIYLSGVGYVDDLTVTLNTSDKKSTAQKPKGKPEDISDYSQRELQQLLYDLEDDLEDLLEEAVAESGFGGFGRFYPAATAPSAGGYGGYDW